MAKYTVTYSCGHTAQVELYGPGKERERKMQWMRESAVCPECYGAQKQAETCESNAGLVNLTGSDKQIAWAMDIRGKYMREMEGQAARLTAGDAAKTQTAMDNMRAVVNMVTEAKWWIDNQYNLTNALRQVKHQQ